MQLPTKFLAGLFLLATVAFTFTSCSNDDENAKPIPQKVSYDITAFGASQISGTAVFEEILNTDSTIVTITLNGDLINQTTNLPIAIHEGTSIENGDVKFDLGIYNGAQSSLIIRLPIAFGDLANFNGSITVSSAGKILAQAEIGINADYKTIKMVNPENTGEQNGQARIYKRGTGSLLVIQLLTESLASQPDACKGVDHPAAILDADGLTDDSFTLTPVADSNGVSITELPNKAYKDFTKYNGSISVVCSETQQQKEISKGTF